MEKEELDKWTSQTNVIHLINQQSVSLHTQWVQPTIPIHDQRLVEWGNAYRYVAMLSHVRPACLPVSLDDITRAMKCCEREKLQEVSSLNFWIWKNHAISIAWHMEWVIFLRAFFFDPQRILQGLPWTTIHHSVQVTSSCLSDTIFLLSWSCWVQSSRPAPKSSEEWVHAGHKNKWLAKSSELVPYICTGCIMIVSAWYLVSFYFLAPVVGALKISNFDSLNSRLPKTKTSPILTHVLSNHICGHATFLKLIKFFLIWSWQLLTFQGNSLPKSAEIFHGSRGKKSEWFEVSSK